MLILWCIRGIWIAPSSLCSRSMQLSLKDFMKKLLRYKNDVQVSKVTHNHIYIRSIYHFFLSFIFFFFLKSILTQQCVVTISPVSYAFFVVIFLRKWKLYIFGKLRVFWIWKLFLAFFSSPPWPLSWIFKMAAVFS